MFSYIHKPIHHIRSNAIAAKLTILFAETSRIMITNQHLRKSIIYSIKRQECILEAASIYSFFEKNCTAPSAT